MPPFPKKKVSQLDCSSGFFCRGMGLQPWLEEIALVFKCIKASQHVRGKQFFCSYYCCSITPSVASWYLAQNKLKVWFNYILNSCRWQYVSRHLIQKFWLIKEMRFVFVFLFAIVAISHEQYHHPMMLMFRWIPPLAHQLVTHDGNLQNYHYNPMRPHIFIMTKVFLLSDYWLRGSLLK